MITISITSISQISQMVTDLRIKEEEVEVAEIEGKEVKMATEALLAALSVVRMDMKQVFAGIDLTILHLNMLQHLLNMRHLLSMRQHLLNLVHLSIRLQGHITKVTHLGRFINLQGFPHHHNHNHNSFMDHKLTI